MIPIGQLPSKRLAGVGQSGKLWRWKRSHHQWLLQFKWKWQKPWKLSEWIKHSDETIMRSRPRAQALVDVMWKWTYNSWAFSWLYERSDCHMVLEESRDLEVLLDLLCVNNFLSVMIVYNVYVHKVQTVQLEYCLLFGSCCTFELNGSNNLLDLYRHVVNWGEFFRLCQTLCDGIQWDCWKLGSLLCNYQSRWFMLTLTMSQERIVFSWK